MRRTTTDTNKTVFLCGAAHFLSQEAKFDKNKFNIGAHRLYHYGGGVRSNVQGFLPTDLLSKSKTFIAGFDTERYNLMDENYDQIP